MTTTTITSFRENVFAYLHAVVHCNDVVNVTTKDGNAVVMSETEFNGLMETLYLTSVPGVRERLLESFDEPLTDMTDASEVDW